MNRLNLNSSREYVAASRVDAGPAHALSMYYVHPLLAGPLADWKGHLTRARQMGFSHVCVGPVFAPAPSGDIFLTDDFERTNPAIAEGQDADTTVRHLAQLCRETGLQLVLDLVLDRVAAEGAMARSAPNWFYRDGSLDVVDPREKQLGPEALPARFAEREHELTAWWTDRVIRLVQAGADGFRLLGLEHVPAPFLNSLIGVVRQETGACLFLGWTPGVPWPHLAALRASRARRGLRLHVLVGRARPLVHRGAEPAPPHRPRHRRRRSAVRGAARREVRPGRYACDPGRLSPRAAHRRHHQPGPVRPDGVRVRRAPQDGPAPRDLR